MVSRPSPSLFAPLSNSIQTPKSQMASHSTHLLLLLLVYFFASAISAAVPAVYVFGDSLADVGNNDYLMLSVFKANFPHNGVDYPGGKATGRFSNGKNSADFLAEKLGIRTLPPYLSIPSNSNRTQAFINGVSFASSGAGVLDSTNPGLCLTLSKQIDYFTTVCTNLVQQMGSAKAQDHLSKSIFAFFIGSNDILAYTWSSNWLTPQQLVDWMITTLQGQLKTIYNLGARKFAFVGTGLIGCCPYLRVQNGTCACNAQVNSISSMYAQGAASLLKDMSSEFTDMSYSFFDSSMTLQQYLQNPAAYGFTVVKTACCGLGNLNAMVACIPISTLCPNRSNHVFWDLFHPTEKSAELLTTTFIEGSAPYVYPINVKQLSNL